MNGTGEENLMLTVDYQRPAIVHDVVVDAGERGSRVHKQQCKSTQNKPHHLHELPDTLCSQSSVLSVLKLGVELRGGVVALKKNTV